jgi:hypothetical protein
MNQSTAPEMEGTNMTNEASWKLYERYLEGWKAISAEERNKIAAEVLDDNVEYSTRLHESGNHQTVIEDMADFQAKFPGGHFDTGDVSSHHEHALLTWMLVQADGTVFAKGHDQIRVSQEGKILSMITFPPSTSNP